MKTTTAILAHSSLLTAFFFSACATANDPAAAPPVAGSPPINLAVIYPAARDFPADLARAVDEIKKKAATNDAQAEVALGWVYYLGAGAPQDVPQATELFEKAAIQGDAEAMLSLGFMQFDTPTINGETKNPPRPDVHEYEQAAAKGNEIAAEILRLQSNPTTAAPSSKLMQWYRKLANLGVPTAEVLQGRENLTGYGGLPQNPQQALVWFLLADAQGSGAADASIGHMYLQGDGVPRDLTEAAKWLKKGANRGAPLALAYLGQLTANSEDAGKNEVEGLAMLYAARAQGTVIDAAAISDIEKRLGTQLLDVAKKRSEEILGPDKVRALRAAP